MEFTILPGYRVLVFLKALESFQPLSLHMPFPILSHLSFWISWLLYQSFFQLVYCKWVTKVFVKIICYAVQMLFFTFITTWKFWVVKHCFRPPSIISLILLFVYIHHTHMHLKIMAYFFRFFKLLNLNVSLYVFNILLDPSIVFIYYTSNPIFKLTEYTNFQALKILRDS